jgi:cytochrome c-type biogenesis protein CcmE
MSALCLASLGWTSAVGAADRACIKKSPDGNPFVVSVEDDGRTWRIENRGGKLLGKIVLTCKVEAWCSAAVALPLASKDELCLGSGVGSLPTGPRSCKIESISVAGLLSWLDTKEEAQWAPCLARDHVCGPGELAAIQLKPGHRFRLAGLVVEGSVKRVGGLAVEFAVADKAKDIKVVYRGLLPDLFREGSNVLLEGGVDPTGALDIEEIAATGLETVSPSELVEALNKRRMCQRAS